MCVWIIRGFRSCRIGAGFISGAGSDGEGGVFSCCAPRETEGEGIRVEREEDSDGDEELTEGGEASSLELGGRGMGLEVRGGRGRGRGASVVCDGKSSSRSG